jgi:hypothetical protein
MSINNEITISVLLNTIKNLQLKLNEEEKRNIEMFHTLYKNANSIFLHMEHNTTLRGALEAAWELLSVIGQIIDSKTLKRISKTQQYLNYCEAIKKVKK